MNVVNHRQTLLPTQVTKLQKKSRHHRCYSFAAALLPPPLTAVSSSYFPLHASPAVVAVSPVHRYISSFLCKQPCTTANSAKPACLNTNSPSKQALKSEMKCSTATTQTVTFSHSCLHTSLFWATKLVPFFFHLISLFKIPQLKFGLIVLFLTLTILPIW